MSYSQYGEEKKIIEYFNGKTDGFFVDIGAADGMQNSNTRSLWELGWSGVLVEPLLPSFRQLCENYKNANNVTLINAAICERNGITEIMECIGEAQWSSMDYRWIQGWESRAKPRSVIGLRLETLNLAPHPDFLSIDTEGRDLSILQSMPETFRPRLIVAETDKFDDAPLIDKYLQSIGYKHLWDCVGNGAWGLA